MVANSVEWGQASVNSINFPNSLGRGCFQEIFCLYDSEIDVALCHISDPYEERRNSSGREKTVCHGIDLVFD